MASTDIPKKLDELYDKALKSKTGFFLEQLEDPDYAPKNTETIKADIDAALQKVIATAERLKRML